MNRKPYFKMIVISLITVLILAGCSLPSMTPPGVSAPTDVPTTTPMVPAAAVPATPAPTIAPVLITSANVGALKAVNKAPAANVRLLTWSADSSVLGLINQNVDDAGNSIFSATVVDTGLNVKYLMAASKGDRFVQVSPDGRQVAAISADGKNAIIYDMGDGNKDIAEIGPQYQIYGMTFSPDGQTFSLTDGDNMAVSLYNLSQSSDPNTFSGFTTAAPVFDVGYAGSANTLVWHARATIQLQDIATKAMGATFSHEDFVTAFTLSADGKMLASASAKTVNGDIKPVVELWDATSGAELHALVVPQAAMSLSFSPDGSLIAVGTGNDVQIWDTASGKQLTTLTGHSAAVGNVAFSPDGKLLASCAQDNQLILWQVVP
jgi:WD40 repeat protein